VTPVSIELPSGSTATEYALSLNEPPTEEDQSIPGNCALEITENRIKTTAPANEKYFFDQDKVAICFERPNLNAIIRLQKLKS